MSGHARQLRRWHTVLVSLAAALIPAAGIVMFLAPRDSAVGFLAYPVALALALLLFRTGQLVEHRANFWRERHAHAQAAEDPRPPVLVLRSFTHPELTAERPTRHVRGGEQLAGTTFLWQISEAVVPFGRLIAIGAPPDGQAARAPEALYLASDDESWFSLFTLVATASRAIILLPDTSEGVAREIRTLREAGLTDRLLVLMPPTPPPPPPWTPFRVVGGKTFALHWERVRTAWEGEGLHLPPYDPAGMLYRATADLSPGERVYLETWLSIPGLRDAIEKLLPPPADDLQPLRCVIAEAVRRGSHLIRAAAE